jgi:hypothetical protein
VRQVADPEHPGDDAYQQSEHPIGRVLEPIQRANDVYILESRVIDGREWWRVADSPYVGCCAPFGWIPGTTGDGQQVLSEPDSLYCPEGSDHLSTYDLIHPEWFDPAVCFGHDEVTFRGYLACTRGLTIDASYFLTGLSSWDQTGVECSLDSRYDSQLTVYGDVAIGLAQEGEYGEFVDVAGHYFDAASKDCRWKPGNYMPMPVDDAPLDTAEFACQMRFVATSINALP